MQKNQLIYEIYTTLLQRYGTQGWWPFIACGYHKGDYSLPRNSDEIFEVALGSILTQNTNFNAVQKALRNLKNMNALTPKSIQKLPLESLKEAIRPSGYYNQKALYILEFIEFFEALNATTPSREALLKVKGIGQESADSILLYGYKQTEFVVDAYTKRVLVALRLIDESAKYADIKALMQNSLQEHAQTPHELRVIYQEYHALLVEHAKLFYSKKPYGVRCFLQERFI